MGGTVHRGEAGQRRWRRTHQRLEHPAATSLLPLARISKLFVVNYMPNTPVGSLDVNISKLIKLKGNLALPRKPSHPLGATTGGIPHEKMVPFFRKNSQVRQLRLNLSLRQVQIERGQPSGKDVRVGDSLRLQQDTALLPRLWTSGSLVKLKLSTSDLPKSRKEKRNDVTSETKSLTYIYRNVSSK
jgi:hypothetical protein